MSKTNTIPVRKLNASTEPDLAGNFSVRDITSLLAGSDMVQQLHRHDFFYILVLIKGNGSHKIDFKTYKVGNESVFLMRPGQVHELVLKAGSEGYMMQFTADFYKPYNTDSKEIFRKATQITLYEAGNFQKIAAILSQILQEYDNKRDHYHEVIGAYLKLLFVELAREHAGTTKIKDAYTTARLDEFLELLEKHITTHKRASQYAGMMNLSLYQLNSITKSTVGKTCTDIINQHIILEAKRYLAGTSWQVSQVADHLGYEDVSYFTRFFKKHTGSPPELFRQNLK